MEVFSSVAHLAQVYFFVPSTNESFTLEEISYVFGRKTKDHARAQWERLVPGNKRHGPREEFIAAVGEAPLGTSGREPEAGNAQASSGVDVISEAP